MTSNRAGKSLLELTVVMGLLSVVLTLATRTITFLMRADASGRTAIVNGTSYTRLANRFRKDVHAAIKAELVAGEENLPQQLQLTQTDGRVIQYRPESGQVQVVVLKGKQREGRETYRLDGGAIRFELTQPTRPLVSLSYETVGNRRRKTLRIDADQGKDHRFSQKRN